MHIQLGPANALPPPARRGARAAPPSPRHPSLEIAKRLEEISLIFSYFHLFSLYFHLQETLQDPVPSPQPALGGPPGSIERGLGFRARLFAGLAGNPHLLRNVSF